MNPKKTCDVGAKSDDPCRTPMVGYYQCGHHTATPGLELRVCDSHAREALGDGAEVYNDAGLELHVVDDEYVWSDA